MPNEVASMHPQEAVEIPAGWQVTFEPGGLHVMLIDLQDVVPGDVYPDPGIRKRHSVT
jgi:copper(I)-binding protein